MSLSTIISMVLINGIVIGGFLLFLRIAMRKEKKKS